MADLGPIQMDEPEFPPLLTGRRIMAGHSLIEAAVAAAAGGELGAGDALWNDDPARIELAIILEPEVPLQQAIQLLPLTMCAVGDCIGAMAPPQVGVMFRWPNTILVNGGDAGRVELVVSGDQPAGVPDWMIAFVSMRFRHEADGTEPGNLSGDVTALAEEGCEELTTIQIMESCARHFLTWLNIWQDDGFKPVHLNWLERVEGRGEPVRIIARDRALGSATVLNLDEDGNLLVKDKAGKTLSLPLLDAVTLHQSQA